MNPNSGPTPHPPQTRPQSTPLEESQILSPLSLFKAVRFALVSAILFLSYFPLRATLAIHSLRNIMADMLEGSRLPSISEFVFGNETLLLLSSLLIPTIAIATLFRKNLHQSFYTLGIIILLALTQFALIFEAFWSPLAGLTQQLGQP